MSDLPDGWTMIAPGYAVDAGQTKDDRKREFGRLLAGKLHLDLMETDG